MGAREGAKHGGSREMVGAGGGEGGKAGGRGSGQHGLQGEHGDREGHGGEAEEGADEEVVGEERDLGGGDQQEIGGGEAQGGSDGWFDRRCGASRVAGRAACAPNRGGLSCAGWYETDT